jgi:hypothetical protein
MSQQSEVAQLRSMFPDYEDDILRAVLDEFRGNMDLTIDSLLRMGSETDSKSPEQVGIENRTLISSSIFILVRSQLNSWQTMRNLLRQSRTQSNWKTKKLDGKERLWSGSRSPSETLPYHQTRRRQSPAHAGKVPHRIPGRCTWKK